MDIVLQGLPGSANTGHWPEAVGTVAKVVGLPGFIKSRPKCTCQHASSNNAQVLRWVHSLHRLTRAAVSSYRVIPCSPADSSLYHLSQTTMQTGYPSRGDNNICLRNGLQQSCLEPICNVCNLRPHRQWIPRTCQSAVQCPCRLDLHVPLAQLQ